MNHNGRTKVGTLAQTLVSHSDNYTVKTQPSVPGKETEGSFCNEEPDGWPCSKQQTLIASMVHTFSSSTHNKKRFLGKPGKMCSLFHLFLKCITSLSADSVKCQAELLLRTIFLLTSRGQQRVSSLRKAEKLCAERATTRHRLQMALRP